MEPKEKLGTIRLYYCQRLKASLSILACKNNREKPEKSPFAAETNQATRPLACDTCSDWTQWEQQVPVREVSITTEKRPALQSEFLIPSSIKDSGMSVKSSSKFLNFGEPFEVSIESVSDDTLNDIDLSKFSLKKNKENFSNNENSSNVSKEKTKKKKEEKITLPVEKKKRGRKSKAEKEANLRLEKISNILLILKNICSLKEKETLTDILEPKAYVPEYFTCEKIGKLEEPCEIDDQSHLILNKFIADQPFPEIEKKLEDDMLESTSTNSVVQENQKKECSLPNTNNDHLRILVHADPLNALEIKKYLIQKYPLAEIICPSTDFVFQVDSFEPPFQSVVKTLELSWASHVVDVHFVELNLNLEEKGETNKISFYIPNNMTLKF